MKPRQRGRYKKKKRDLILYLKITLIFYLAFFGVAYMSSDTSAYLSSRSVITETITAGIWEVPEVLTNACGMDDLTDKVSGEESEPNAEDEANHSQEETVEDTIISEEKEVDCGEQSDASEGKAETDVSDELDCKKTNVLETKENKSNKNESNEKVMIDCKDEDEEKAAETPAIDKEKEEKEKEAEDAETSATDKEKEEKENAMENIETAATEKENEANNQVQSITEEKEAGKDDGVKTGMGESKENEGQKPNNESLNQPKSNDEMLNKSDEGSQS